MTSQPTRTLTTPEVRPARKRDLPHLAAIEDSGVALFESVLGDLTGTALAAPAPPGEERAADGFVLVAETAPDEPPVGFVHVRIIDGHAHLDQLSVRPDHGRRGVGKALVEAACERLSVHGHGSVTLLTYADLPWNAPFYARIGFVEVPDEEPRPGHVLVLLQHEESLGLGRHGRRVLMRRVLRKHRTVEELTAFLPVIDAAPEDEGTLRLIVRRPATGAREVLDVGVLDLRVGLAGDQLFLDLDLSHDNLPAWSRLRIGGEGGAVIQVTDQPHNGCGKFIARFGKDAMTFVNGPEGKPRRLRGLCARVVSPGVVRAGDRVLVERPGD